MIALHPLKRLIGAPALAVLALSLPAAMAQAQQQVGTAAAVNPAAQARGSGGARTIIIGQSIAHRERIQTTSAGSVQLLFLDKTSMTIGPNSDLAIDEYVYDPNSNTGKLAATLTKGVMRFVGGQISHAGNAQVSTPNAVVGIRGGVGIFNTQNVYIGYGQGTVTSGSSTVTLDAGEFTQTLGGGTPPTNPTTPPAGFIQSLLTTLQSQQGQGGGARATAGQINQARTNASGTPTGNIATNVQNSVPTNPNAGNPGNTVSSINQTVQTTVNQSRIETGIRQEQQQQQQQVAQTLTGWTGGLIQSFNQSGPVGPLLVALGVATVDTNASGNPIQAGLFVAAVNPSNNNNSNFQNAYQAGEHYFGPNHGVINTGDNLVPVADVLQPSVDSSGRPKSIINGEYASLQNAGFVEIKPGTALAQAAAQAVGTTFCQCEYTKWGVWGGDSARGASTSSSVRDSIDMFWVAGRLPASASDVPTTGSATYTGHAIANIRNGNQSYVAAGQLQNTINFASRTGNATVTGLDGTNYAGSVYFSSDPRYFASGLSGVNNTSRTMVMTGNFFQGRTSPVGEMGGLVLINGSNNYYGSGIFAGKMQ